MDISANTVKELTRHTSAYKIPVTNVSRLISLNSCLKGKVLQDFTSDYGNLLSFLNTSFDLMALITLFQFYDPQLRCFAFQDYQLVPTLEEYSYILNIRITDVVPFVWVPKVVRFEKIFEALHLGIKEVERNWKSTCAIRGFYLCFLISKAEESAKKKCWEDFCRLLAIMIYGIVLFPSVENFVSLSAICVFMNKNHVPTLLADTYFAIHSRNGKGGHVGGGIIVWEDWNIISSCGQYSNVPLMGTRDCINYNPTLAYRLLEFAMEGPPEDAEIVELVYFADGKDPMELEKISRTWTRVHKRNQTTLSKKVPIAMGLYMDWVKARVKDLLFPFGKSDPLYEQPLVVMSDTVSVEFYT
ncbi:uncharacterized protein LOC131659342 [Vicia villosa]|uniref:uncharacterized protein LOC131659342 n=1 Tax=Vicia villosa TaxID=3911 RepID=UPI00273C4951|nr:uncharacterized protein LOC131659342 [Vicia villosa]